MSHQPALHLLALSMVKGLGPVNARNLVAYCGSAEKVFSTPKGKLERIPGIGEKLSETVIAADTLRQAEAELSWCEQNNVRVIPYLSEEYPLALKVIHDAPLVLFVRGNVLPNAQPGIGIVGTRRATDYGRELAATFATYFAERGLNVVSGLAYGIDIAAHKAALNAGGITTAVLGNGLGTVYPGAHAQRAREMQERGGLISEYLHETGPDAVNFPARNRIISGMCKAIVVIEAAESGGALITARYAFDQNREVYAVPGRVGDAASAGCNMLIRDNVAKLVLSPQQILDDLEIVWQPTDQRPDMPEPTLPFDVPDLPLSAEESKVINLLAVQGDHTVDQIIQKTGISVSLLNSLLIGMEFKGLIRQLPGKKYTRSRG